MSNRNKVVKKNKMNMNNEMMDKTKWKYMMYYCLLQFTFSFILAFNLFKIFAHLDENFIGNIGYLICTVISLGGCVFMIRRSLKSEEGLHNLFLYVAIPLCLLYIFLVIPNVRPDEDQHFWRAYDVSNGNLVSEEEGIIIPEEFYGCGSWALINYKDVENSMEQIAYYNNLASSKSTARGYHFISYIPAALGFYIGRIFQINLLKTIILAKILNMIQFLVLGYYTIKMVPIGKFIMFVYLLNPMMLYMETAVSADCLLNVISLFYIAYLFKLIYEKETISLKKLCIIMGLLFIILLIKEVYVFLILLIIPLIRNSIKSTKFKQKNTRNILIIIVTMGVFILLFYICGSESINKIMTNEKTAFIFMHPIAFLNKILCTLKELGVSYLSSFAGGILDWYTLINSTGSQWIYLVLLYISPFFITDKRESFGNRILLVTIFVMSVLVLLTGCYVGWNDPSVTVIGGVQGRYFIPFAILPVYVLLCGKGVRFKYYREAFILGLTVVSILTISVDAVQFF